MNTYNVYCDESRYTNPFEQYFLIAALCCPRDQKPLIESRFKAVRRKFGFMPELKWANITEMKIPYLNELLQVFFTSEIDFRCIIIDKSKLNLDKAGQVSELPFYKFYYLLLKGLLTVGSKYYVFVDERTKTERRRLIDLQNYLRSATIKLNEPDKQTNEAEIFSTGSKYIQQIQEVNSKESIFIQVLDILMGAVGYYWNGFRGSPAKIKFIENLVYRLEKQDLKFSSKLYDKKWNQFVWEPRK